MARGRDHRPLPPGPLRWLVWASLLPTAACSTLLGDPFDVRPAAPDAGTRLPNKTPMAGRPPEAASGGTAAVMGDRNPSGDDAGTMDSTPATSAAMHDPSMMGQAKAPEMPSNDEDAGADAGAFPRLGECRPTFQVSNAVRYPANAGDVMFAIDDHIDTDVDPRCDSLTPLHCVVVGREIRVPEGGNLGVTGSRPLVLLAANDVTLDGVVNVAGGDGAAGTREKNGPGDHSAGTALAASGGGGNSTPGGGNCDGRGAGRNIARGLIAGGDGAPADSAGCTAGGGGGGALQIVSLCGTIRVNHFINARGGGGIGGSQWNPNCYEGYGGGAGGTVWLQAQTVELADPRQKPLVIQLSGGGGGGGACRQSDMKVVAGSQGHGHPPNREPAPGGVCEGGVVGGNGGLGGLQNVNPSAGAKPTGDAYCGGGGGARGRLILQTPSFHCAGSEPYHEGGCEELELSSP